MVWIVWRLNGDSAYEYSPWKGFRRNWFLCSCRYAMGRVFGKSSKGTTAIEGTPAFRMHSLKSVNIHSLSCVCGDCGAGLGFSVGAQGIFRFGIASGLD